jgi:tetratricopeptide (TPR) repeat protein
MKTIFFSLLVFSASFLQAQEPSEYVKGVSKLACECIGKIDINTDQKKKSEEIVSCIKQSNTTYQIEQSFAPTLEKIKDSLSKTTQKGTDTIQVKGGETAINSDKSYEEIEEYLYENCTQLKEIYFSDNEKHENSISDKKKAMKFYDQGVEAYDNQDYKKAIKLYKKAVRNDKNFAFAWDNLGLSYRRLEQFDKAIECYETSLKLDPKGKMPLMNIAVAHSLNEDFESAKKYYKIYSGYYENDPEGYYGIGRLYFIEKDYSPALDNMIRAYILYNQMKSPYYLDAQKHIAIMYNELKKQGKLEVFNQMAKKHKLEVETED